MDLLLLLDGIFSNRTLALPLPAASLLTTVIVLQAVVMHAGLVHVHLISMLLTILATTGKVRIV
jgi:hypothetical protein